MQLVAYYLFFAAPGLASASTEIIHEATSQFATQRLTLRTMSAQTFGKQVDTEYDEEIRPEQREILQVDNNGLTLGIAIGTQPLTLRRFGAGNIVTTAGSLKKFGSQDKVPSKVPLEEAVVDGLQRWGIQGREPSELPVDWPLKFPSQDPQGSDTSSQPKVPQSSSDQQPITMSEAMVPHASSSHWEAEQSSIVLSTAPLGHSWKRDPDHGIAVAEASLDHFGEGAAVADLDLNWHLAWQTAPGATNVAKTGRSNSKSKGAQQLAAESSETSSNEGEVAPSFEPIVQMGRYIVLAMCIALIALQMFRFPKTEAHPFLSS